VEYVQLRRSSSRSREALFPQSLPNQKQRKLVVCKLQRLRAGHAAQPFGRVYRARSAAFGMMATFAGQMPVSSLAGKPRTGSRVTRDAVDKGFVGPHKAVGQKRG